MIDFTSSLYLGMKHASSELPGWTQLTTGVPAALYESPVTKQIGQKLAQLQGFEKGALAPSTLHLYWDLFGFLSKKNIAVFIDEKVYPVSSYGVERLQLVKIPVYNFRHLDANHLDELVKKTLSKSQIPVVITDGWCTQCGKPSPIKYYDEIVSPFQGNIIIDDTQAFGILGEITNQSVYGTDGGGLLKWLNVHRHNMITITSLAKAFGVPVAVISGNSSFIEAFMHNSDTRLYSSPVSKADVQAVLNALSINQTSGNQLRKMLWSNVSFLRDECMAIGLNLTGGIFPVQSIQQWPQDRVKHLVEKLGSRGIKTALVMGHMNQALTLTVIVRSDTTINEIKTFAYSIQVYI